MFYYIHEWYKWFNSFSNGIKKDEITAQEIPFEEPLPTQRIEKSGTELITGEIPFEEPLPKQRIYGTGWKYK